MEQEKEECRVRLLPPEVANQIAAGEVVERPVAVIKELVENALDAGARAIEIEFRQGGRSLLMVRDDGAGMTPAEARLAVQRHATSKISKAADLLQLSSFGFRGEALPSIASVSHFRLRTRPADAPEGFELEIDGGRVVAERACGMPSGTEVRVTGLFSSVPARRKFLKSDRTEGAHIVQLSRLLAVAHPSVAFALIEDGRELFRSPSCADLAARLREVWAKGLPTPLHPVAGEEEGLRLWGLVGPPGTGRATRQELVTYVNERPVESRLLQYAVGEATAGHFPKGRHPVAFLFLELAPAAVDVNVHPAKREVRFRDEGTVRRFVLETLMGAWDELAAEKVERVRQATPAPSPVYVPPLRDRSSTPYGSTGESTGPETISRRRRDSEREGPSASAMATEKAGGLPEAPRWEPGMPVKAAEAGETWEEANAELASESNKVGGPPAGEAREKPAEGGSEKPAEERALAAERADSLPPLPWRFLGWLQGREVLFESAGGLIVFSPPAARARVAYEQASGRQGHATPQELLFPEPVELDPVGAALLREGLVTFREAGFHLEPFGRLVYRLEAAPFWVEGNPAELVRDLVANLREKGGSLSPHLWREELAKLAAQRAARGGGERSEGAISLLARQLLATAHPLTDPSGRPTFFELSQAEIRRRLGMSAPGQAEA